MWNLRTGQTPNPTWETIRSLADFFGVAPGYFFGQDDAAAPAAMADPELQALMDDIGVWALAGRGRRLTPASRRVVMDVLRAIEEREQ